MKCSEQKLGSSFRVKCYKKYKNTFCKTKQTASNKTRSFYLLIFSCHLLDSDVLFCQHYSGYFFLFRKHLFLKVLHIKYFTVFVQHFIQVHIVSSWSFRFTSCCLLHNYLSPRTEYCNRSDSFMYHTTC